MLLGALTQTDDSGSMKFEDGGERINDLKLILSRVVHAAMLFDDDGISLRFINWTPPLRDPRDPPGKLTAEMLDGVRNEQDLSRIMNEVKFSGLTEIGGELRKKVLDELVRDRIPELARRHHQPSVPRGTLSKPILVITITDGNPQGEPRRTIFESIGDISRELSNLPLYGRGAISFQFAQVGNDKAATDFLAELDKDPQIGQLVDCTSSKGFFIERIFTG